MQFTDADFTFCMKDNASAIDKKRCMSQEEVLCVSKVEPRLLHMNTKLDFKFYNANTTLPTLRYSRSGSKPPSGLPQFYNWTSARANWFWPNFTNLRPPPPKHNNVFSFPCGLAPIPNNKFLTHKISMNLADDLSYLSTRFQQKDSWQKKPATLQKTFGWTRFNLIMVCRARKGDFNASRLWSHTMSGHLLP